jgi:hypothetical protein
MSSNKTVGGWGPRTWKNEKGDPVMLDTSRRCGSNDRCIIAVHLRDIVLDGLHQGEKGGWRDNEPSQFMWKDISDRSPSVATRDLHGYCSQDLQLNVIPDLAALFNLQQQLPQMIIVGVNNQPKLLEYMHKADNPTALRNLVPYGRQVVTDSECRSFVTNTIIFAPNVVASCDDAKYDNAVYHMPVLLWIKKDAGAPPSLLLLLRSAYKGIMLTSLTTRGVGNGFRAMAVSINLSKGRTVQNHIDAVYNTLRQGATLPMMADYSSEYGLMGYTVGSDEDACFDSSKLEPILLHPNGGAAVCLFTLRMANGTFITPPKELVLEDWHNRVSVENYSCTLEGDFTLKYAYAARQTYMNGKGVVCGKGLYVAQLSRNTSFGNCDSGRVLSRAAGGGGAGGGGAGGGAASVTAEEASRAAAAMAAMAKEEKKRRIAASPIAQLWAKKPK